jgi:general stress protein YciG
MAQSGSGNPGNFANDREKAAEAGKKGGEHSHSGSGQSSGASHSGSGSHGGGSDSGGSGTGNPGNFANDREKASEAGKKGGQHSHGG